MVPAVEAGQERVDAGLHGVADPREARDAWTARAHLSKSWSVAVLVCAGDETAELAAVVKDLDLDTARFHFCFHKDATIDALAGSGEAGFGLDAVDEGIRDLATLHKLLGIDVNVQIVNDHAAT